MFETIQTRGELAELIVLEGKKKTGRFYISGKRMYDRIVIRKNTSEEEE